MSSFMPELPTTHSRELRRNRTRTPFGDEDIPVVFAGSCGRDLSHRRVPSYRKTALIYDERMILHKNVWFSEHLECAERLTTTIDRCTSYGTISRCLLLTAEPVQDHVLTYCHDAAYIGKIMKTETMTEDERKSYTSTFDSAYFNEHTCFAAKLAVGSVIKAVESVHRGDVRNAFCLVRPPGHHALSDEACGFCVFNNVAVAARYAINELRYNRILVVDWDVHHGNSTQTAFYDDPSVLFISIHRYDNQEFWPNLRESNYDFTGTGGGFGYNINIALNDKNICDVDYLTIFHRLIMPIAYEFDPELILISAGYDSAYGCPLGELKLSPSIYAHLTHKLMCLADGKIVISLEGGYYLDSLSESVNHTISALLGDPIPSLEPLGSINPSVLQTIENCVSVLRHRWKSLHIFPLADVLPIPDLSKLKIQSWSDVKVPNFEPTDYDHTEEAKIEINKHLSRLKQLHPVARNSTVARACLVYDSRMENHKNEDDRHHPETPLRIRRAYELLDEYGLSRRCKRVEPRLATRAELLRVHTAEYVDHLAATATMNQTSLNDLGEREDSVFFNRHTYSCASLACGSVLAVVDEICTGGSLTGFALVRPPGHHALPDRSMGFCFFNHVAVAARHAQTIYGLQRIAIIDWDVHHGNGTSKIFEDDPNVLYISVHRFDDGRFYPNNDDASYKFCGTSEAMGRTVNVSWSGRHMKDGEYISVFNHLIIPILYEFRPQLILVSAGYDALRGDRLGGIGVSPECFGHLTAMLLTVSFLVPSVNSLNSYETVNLTDSSKRQTRQSHQRERAKSFAGGLVLVLEGGYNISAISEAVCQSVSSLLGDCCPRLSTNLCATEKSCKAINRTLKVQEKYWDILKGYVPVSCHYDNNLNEQSAYTGRHSSQNRPSNSGPVELDGVSLNDDILSPIQINLNDELSYALALSQQQPDLLSTTESTTPINRPLSTQINQTVTEAQVSTRPQDNTTYAQTVPIIQEPSSSRMSQSMTTIAQLADEFTNLTVHTDPVDRSSLASEIESDTLYTQSSDQPSSASIRILTELNPINQTVNGTSSSTTLQQLINLTNLDTEDIHSILGLDNADELPTQLFAVNPLNWCPHLTDVQPNPNWQPNINSLCCRCTNERENWVCLSCYAICCGRYANSHMIEHFTSVRHPIVLSFADLSIWCYECESYVHNEILLEAKSAVHRAKFGVGLPGGF